jgi:hypothetical protein
MNMTLKNGALLITRLLGFYLVFYAFVDLTYYPNYWIHSTFSHSRSLPHGDLQISADLTFIMFCVREAMHFLLGMYLLGRPHRFVAFLIKAASDSETV